MGFVCFVVVVLLLVTGCWLVCLGFFCLHYLENWKESRGCSCVRKTSFSSQIPPLLSVKQTFPFHLQPGLSFLSCALMCLRPDKFLLLGFFRQGGCWVIGYESLYNHCSGSKMPWHWSSRNNNVGFFPLSGNNMLCSTNLRYRIPDTRWCITFCMFLGKCLGITTLCRSKTAPKMVRYEVADNRPDTLGWVKSERHKATRISINS